LLFKNVLFIIIKRDVSREIEGIVPNIRLVLTELGVLFPDVKRGIAKKASFLKFDA
jgi:hypothetical protein